MQNRRSPAERGHGGRSKALVSWQEPREGSPEDLRSQAFAAGREHEQEARRRALDAVSLYGGHAFAEAALARFYARSAMNLMGGAYV